MAEVWEIILPIIGAGVVGYIIRLLEEKRRRTHEKEMEYRKELRKHLPDLIEPLFALLVDLHNSLFMLREHIIDWKNVMERKKFTYKTIRVSDLEEVERALNRLETFIEEQKAKIDLLFPHPLRSYNITPVLLNIGYVMKEARQERVGAKSLAEYIQGFVSELACIQSDLQRTIGFETRVQLKGEYGWEKFLRPESRLERLKRKLRKSK